MNNLAKKMTYLNKTLQFVHTQAKFSHAGFEEFAETIFLHQLHEDSKGFFLRHLFRKITADLV